MGPSYQRPNWIPIGTGYCRTMSASIPTVNTSTLQIPYLWQPILFLWLTLPTSLHQLTAVQYATLFNIPVRMKNSYNHSHPGAVVVQSQPFGDCNPVSWRPISLKNNVHVVDTGSTCDCLSPIDVRLSKCLVYRQLGLKKGNIIETIASMKCDGRK